MSSELEERMANNNIEVEGKNFRVLDTHGTWTEYHADDEKEYQWAPTAGGGLLIYRKTIHKMFSAVLKDERVLMLGPGEWRKVEIIE